MKKLLQKDNVQEALLVAVGIAIIAAITLLV
jgi:hypothetical protein